MKNYFKDKRVVFAYVLVIVLLVLTVTYAIQDNALGLNVNTSIMGIDESVYGDTSFDASGIEFKPILDSEVENSYENVIKIDFVVGGASNNEGDNIIYDIALNDLVLDDELLSPYIKWKLIKDDEEISVGSLDSSFDVVVDGRMVVTNIQEKLPKYSESKEEYHNYTFYMWFSDSCQTDLETCRSNGDLISQEYMLNKNLSGKIEIELFTGTPKEHVRTPSFANYIKNLYNDGSEINTVHIGGDSSKPTVSLNETQGIMLDNNGEYRYYGSNPNNYVEFNGELWRIISSSKVKTSEENSAGLQRVKLIRNSSIGDYQFYDSGSGYSDAPYGFSSVGLSKMLNETYYSRQLGTCYYLRYGEKEAYYEEYECDFSSIGLGGEARDLVDDAVWYLGVAPNPWPSPYFANDYYDFERRILKCEEISIGEGGSSRICPNVDDFWVGKVALIYPSDYLYATDLSVCNNNGYEYVNDLYNCANTNWLYEDDKYEYTIMDHGGYAVTVFSENFYPDKALQDLGISPTVYLKNNVIMVDGDGSKDNPYIIK